MSASCCATSVPHPHGSFEVFPKAVAAWQERLTAGLSRSIQASDETMGHMEEEILHKTRDLQRAVLEEAAQKKAEKSPPTWRFAFLKTSTLKGGHQTSRAHHTTPTFTQLIGGNDSNRQSHFSPPSRPIQSWPVVVPK
jgi:hypothetical protein